MVQDGYQPNVPIYTSQLPPSPTWGVGTTNPAPPGQANGGYRVVDIGGGVSAIMDPDGNAVQFFKTDTGGGGGNSGPGAGYYAAQTDIGYKQLEQADRELAASIKQAEDDLAEKRRQFDISTGLERERLAQEIKMLEMDLNNKMAIASLDANTRLAIANMEKGTAEKQIASTENIAKGNRALETRKYAVEGLGRDTVRNSLFMSGFTGGRTPYEAFQQSPEQMALLQEAQASPAGSGLPPGWGGGMAEGGVIPIHSGVRAYEVGEKGKEILIKGPHGDMVVPMGKPKGMVEGGILATDRPEDNPPPAIPPVSVIPPVPSPSAPPLTAKDALEALKKGDQATADSILRGVAGLPAVPAVPIVSGPSVVPGFTMPTHTPTAADALAARRAGENELADYILRTVAGLEPWDIMKARAIQAGESMDPLDLLRKSIRAAIEGRKGAFGALPDINIPGVNEPLPNPAAIARTLLRYRATDPRMQTLLSGYDVAGLSADEVMAMARAASPRGMLSGGLIRAY